MREISNTTEPISDGYFSSQTGSSDPLDGWDAEFDDFNGKQRGLKNPKIIRLANKKHSLIDYLKNKIKIQFDITQSPSGWDHKACCPFKDHQDNSPSFYCNSKGNVFKCQGCGKGGGLVQFIAFFTGRDFYDVAEEILSLYSDEDNIYEELQDEPDDKSDVIIFEFTENVRAFIFRNADKPKAIKFVESVTWTLDMFLEKHNLSWHVIDSKNLSALTQLLKDKLDNYESNINNR